MNEHMKRENVEMIDALRKKVMERLEQQEKIAPDMLDAITGAIELIIRYDYL